MRASRERGFSLLIVFMLILVMVGLAMGIVLATQQDLSVAGKDREQLESLYAAEYAVAQAKATLATTSPPAYAGNWDPLFSAAMPPAIQNLLCQPGAAYPNSAAPGTLPKATNPPIAMPAPWVQAATPAVTYQFCFHNNADDPGYLARTPPFGDQFDNQDPLSFIVIEAWGRVQHNNVTDAVTHLAVTVGKPSLAQQTQNQCYGVQGGCGGGNGMRGQ